MLLKDLWSDKYGVNQHHPTLHCHCLDSVKIELGDGQWLVNQWRCIVGNGSNKIRI